MAECPACDKCGGKMHYQPIYGAPACKCNKCGHVTVVGVNPKKAGIKAAFSEKEK
jgi:uncharacterized Zn finger protein